MPKNDPTPTKPANRAALYSSATDDWPTPMDFFAALDAEFGFVLDVCASTANHKAPDYYALDHADRARRDGLAADWAADAAALQGPVWMNSPYGRAIGTWMAKAVAAARAGAVVVALVPVRADTAWWHEHVLGTGAEVRYIRGRLTFGDAKNTAAFASAVVIYRPTDEPGTNGPVTTMPAHPTPAAPAAATATEGPDALESAATWAARPPQPSSPSRPLARPGGRDDRRTTTWHGSFAGERALRPVRTGRQIDSPTRRSHNHKKVERMFDFYTLAVSPAGAAPYGATDV